MRVIELSPIDDEMRTRDAVLSFFNVELRKKSRAGRFGLTEAKKNMSGIRKGTLLLFTYQTECMFLARADGEIVRPPATDWIAYFVVDVDSIAPIGGSLDEFEKALKREGLSSKHLVTTQAWPILPESCEAFTLSYFRYPTRSKTRRKDTSMASGHKHSRWKGEPIIEPDLVTVDEIIAFVSENPGEYLTAAGNARFSVGPKNDGINFVVGNRGRNEELDRVKLTAYVDIFNKRPSFNSSPFRGKRAAYFCSSYFLGLVKQIQIEKLSVDELLAKLACNPLGIPIKDFEIRPSRKHAGKGWGAPYRRRSLESQKVGNYGELIALKAERDRLREAGRSDLAARVEHVADKGLTPGYDISSFENDGVPRYVEVKASSGKTFSSVELTANEWEVASRSSHARAYHIYLVSDVFGVPTRFYVNDCVYTSKLRSVPFRAREQYWRNKCR